MARRLNILKTGFIMLLFLSLTVLPDVAQAHKVNVFAWVEGDTVFVESKFSGGKKVKAGRIVVTDREDRELLTGLTDDKGSFSFKIPRKTDLTIALDAGQGHRGEWTLHVADVQVPSTAAAPGINAVAVDTAEKEIGAAHQTPLSTPESLPQSIGRNDLERILEAVLDRKLRPITQMIADQQTSAPSFRDIMAGIGTILGLAGIAAYVKSRKNRK